MDFFVGQSASTSKTITEYDVYSFAGICGDFNPFHVDKVEAEKSRFGGRIAHGALVVSFVSSVLGTKLPGNGTIYLSQDSKFVKPVYIGDTITAEVVIQKIEEKKATLMTIVKNQNGEIVVTGSAKVILPD